MKTETTHEYISEIDRLKDLADRAVNNGIKLGATQLEVIVQTGFTRSLEFKMGDFYGIQQQSDTSIVVRSYIGKQLGISSGSSLSESTLEDVVNSAVELSKLSPPDPKFESLAKPIDRQTFDVKKLFDSNLANFDPSDFVVYADDLIQGAKETHEKTVVNGSVRVSTNERVVANSLGINASNLSTSFSGSASTTIPLDPRNVGSGMEYFMVRTMEEKIDANQIGKISGEKAVKSLNAKSGPSGTLSVLLNQRATGRSIQSLIGSGVNGFSVMMGTSYYADKIGEALAIEDLTVVDNPHEAGGMGSRPVDAEGTPTSNVTVMKDGILMSYITDSYTSQQLGVENTGSAVSMGKVPKPTMMQVQISPGEDNFEDMLADMKEGIYMESPIGGMFHRGSPNISNKIDRGFYVKNGEIQYPIKNTMLGTNIYDLMKNIDGISKEVRSEFGSKSPAILFSSIDIGGASEDKKAGPQTTMSSF